MVNQVAKPAPTRWVTWQLVAPPLILAALSWLAWASRSGLAGWEISLFNWINHWPAWLVGLMALITMLGTWQFAVLAVVGCLVAGRKALAWRIGLAALLAGLLSVSLKIAVNRPRPLGLLPDTITRWPDLLQDQGFPSGHSATAAAVAVAILLCLPAARRRTWFWLLAMLPLAVGLSRIYLGVHLPLDVLGGWAVGWLAAGIAQLAFGCQSKRFWL
ncbi:MAG: phosphatase PAP2 family protein [Candidatus Chaera renei]|uniref:Phosphatase PAP2 family protein n=1 Tax=Candidatus Chaera renei TaxID=2506947 RepID=A0A4Q0AK24_9BACT|nr:MAG: phosphatase PAP2 family protein [Candidatus Chaera renei]